MISDSDDGDGFQWESDEDDGDAIPPSNPPLPPDSAAGTSGKVIVDELILIFFLLFDLTASFSRKL